jgi:arylsulfatase A-like enzyme
MITFAQRPSGAPRDSTWHSYRGPGNLPQLDMSLSTLLDDLQERGMLETTLVVAMGEFGRTPKINKTAGRDHYPNAGSVLMAGANVAGGAVIGATDKHGTEPRTRPHGPEDIAASIYHALGIDPHETYFPRLPRPTPIADGNLIDGLFS